MESDAFEMAVMRHKDRIHSYATSMLRDREEAQDVAQDALIRLWRNRRKVDPRGAGLWLMRTVHNLCIDRLRKRKVRAEVADGESVMQVKPDRAPGPQRLTESAELGRMIRRGLNGLSVHERAVVLMREVQGMPYDEIATVLAVPLGTLKARLHRARDRLRTKLSRAGVTP